MEQLSASKLRYHTLQWEETKRSTLAFDKFCSERLANAKSVIDLGAGAGGATATLAAKYRNVNFTAVDNSQLLVNIGEKLAAQKEIRNLTFVQDDWLNLSHTSNQYDGCISLQALMVFRDYRRPLEQIFRKIKANWVALTSLFYEGDISSRCEVEEHSSESKFLYSVFSIPAINRVCHEHGYRLIKASPFHIDIDIPKPENLDIMGTYTRKLVAEDGFEERLQISGPLLMSWYMLLIEKA